jgi:hypothetical protein
MPMNFEKALKKGNGFTLIDVTVSAGAKEAKIPAGFNEWRKTIEIRVRSQAKEGKANNEIINEMKRIFQTDVEIVKGTKSNQKTLKVHTDYENVLQILRKRFEKG